MSVQQRGRQLLGVIGAVAMAVTVALSGPAAAAQAAGRPDYGASLVRYEYAARPNRSYQFMATFRRHGTANGPVKMSFFLQDGFGQPSIQSTPGYSCTKSYSEGIMPGWMVECSARGLGLVSGKADFIMITSTTPAQRGDYALIASIWPQNRADEADDSDNIDSMTVSIR